MDKIQEHEMHQIGGIAVSHTALICALLSVMRERGLLDAATVNEVFDRAAATLEAGEGDSPFVLRNARRQLDIAARAHAVGPEAAG